MSIDKAQLKILITNNLGATIEDRLEGERKAMHELTGAAVALKQAAQKVPRDLIAKLEREQEEGTNVIKDGLEGHKVVGLIKLWLTKASDYLGHLADVEQQKAIVQGGRAAGLEEAMGIVKKERDDTAQRLAELAAAADADAPPPVADQRSAAAQARAEHGSLAERRAAAAAQHDTAAGESSAKQDAPPTVAALPPPTPPSAKGRGTGKSAGKRKRKAS